MGLLSAFENAVPQEIPQPTQVTVEGEIPPGLRGVLYRNGPGQFTIYGDRYQHLFDGDGLATRLSFEADGVYYTSRFVQSAEKQKEDAAGKRIYGTYATRPVGGSIRRFVNREFKNVSNTNLVHQWDALFSLYEGGPPYRLDPHTLETVGAELFDNRLADQQKFSAHPHHDPDTGDLWNFGLTRKKETTITVYNMQKSGGFEVPFQSIIPYSGIVHDFAFTKNTLVFVVPPVKLPRVPLGLMLGQRSYYESLEWYPNEPTCILLIDRNSGKETRLYTEPFLSFHMVNAWEENGVLQVDLCNFEDFGIMKNMARLIAGEKPEPSVSYLERLSIDGDTVTRRRLCDTSMEFPRVDHRGWGTRRRVYFGTSWAGREWISIPMKYEVDTGECRLAMLGSGEYAGEAVPVPKAGGGVDDVWLMFTVFNVEKNESSVFIVDADDITGPPVAKLILPQRIPIPLHGNWVPASADR